MEDEKCLICGYESLSRIDTPDDTFWWCCYCGSFTNGRKPKYFSSPKSYEALMQLRICLKLIFEKEIVTDEQD